MHSQTNLFSIWGVHVYKNITPYRAFLVNRLQERVNRRINRLHETIACLFSLEIEVCDHLVHYTVVRAHTKMRSPPTVGPSKAYDGHREVSLGFDVVRIVEQYKLQL